MNPSEIPYYDKEGQRIDLFTFAGLFDDKDYQRVAHDSLGSTVEVSTVWLGIDHNWGHDGDHEPLIFETMIFGGPHDGAQWRYSTMDEAIAAHGRILVDLKARRVPKPYE